MTRLKDLLTIVEEAEAKFNKERAILRAGIGNAEMIGTADTSDDAPSSDTSSGTACHLPLKGKALLVKGDNLELMKRLPAESLQLVYIDPPFFSGANYRTSEKAEAYSDIWEGGLKEYLEMLAVRFFYIRELLTDEGCLWVHLDWHAVHYVKIMLDEIFGADNFVNEIVWQYKSGGSCKRHFARKHDTLLFYSKSKRYYFNLPKEKSYNRGLKPYKFKGVEEFEDELGWYTMVNMKDVWQIDMVGRTSGERTGYATQKPEALLTRIIESCSRPGDTVADFFGGAGTLAAVAAKTGRSFISCDIGSQALAAQQSRLAALGANYEFINLENL